MKHLKFFRPAIMAGIAISLGCIVNLKVGDIAGAMLFTFGLLTVVHYQLPLFTGKAGFLKLREWKSLVMILLGNVVGCFVMAMAATIALPDLYPIANVIVEKHLAYSWEQQLLLSMGCGFIMTTAVEFGSKGQYLPLLFGVPVFILSGFIHSIADAFYMMAAWNRSAWISYLVIMLGNYLGCNLYRLFINKKFEN